MTKDKKEEDDKPIKINKWDSSALKNTMDDACRKVMKDSLKYTESHLLTDVRLLICTLAVGFAGFALLWDFLHPFPQSRPVLMICVASYFILMGVLTLYTMRAEKNIFMVALNKDEAGVDPDIRWELASTLPRFSDRFKLTLTMSGGQSQQIRTATMERSVGEYFDVNGTLVFANVERDVKTMHDDLSGNKKDK